MSLIVTYRTDFSFIIPGLPLVMIWLGGGRGSLCVVRLREMVEQWYCQHCQAWADLFFKLLTPLWFWPGQPPIISGLSLDFQILQTDLGTRGSDQPTHRTQSVFLLLLLLQSRTAPLCLCLYLLYVELYGSAWSSSDFMKLSSPLWWLVVLLFTTTTTPQSDLSQTCNETNPLPPMSDYDVGLLI